MTLYADISKRQKPKKPVTTYYERKIGKTLYRVTNVYKGEIELGKALEDLTINKILRDENTDTYY